MALPVVCTLDAASLPGRVEEWRALLARATAREEIAGGLRARFGKDVRAADVADLASRELDCCAFFSMSIHLDHEGLALDVTAPPEALPLVSALFTGDFESVPKKSCGCA